MHAQRAIVAELLTAFKENGYEVMQFDRSCFDICAKNAKRTVLLKVLVNIDSFTENQANDLAKMANAMDASAALVGLHGRNFIMKDNFVYERYNIPSMNPQTFSRALDDFFPAVFSKKGKPVVRVNTDELNRLRQENKLSYKDLGEKVNASKKTMYVIEKGGIASEEISNKLESFFDTIISNTIDIFDWSMPTEKRKDLTMDEQSFVDKTHNFGLESVILRNAPVNMITISKNKMVMGDWNKSISKQKAQMMKDLAEFCTSYNMLITDKEDQTKYFEEIPIVSLLELSEIKTERQFIRMIIKRG